MNACDVTIVDIFAALQAASTFAAPAEKLIIAGTRPADINAKVVTAAPFAFGNMTPTQPPSSASGINLRPRMAVPSRSLR